jgi:hypothetical protein
VEEEKGVGEENTAGAESIVAAGTGTRNCVPLHGVRA